MEIRFCERCHESIPDVDFDSGRAVRIDDKSLHLACAMRRALSLSGPRSTFVLLLALLGAGIGTYLLVRSFVPAESGPEVPAAVERRIDEARQGAVADVDGRLRPALEKQRTETDARITEAVGVLQKDLANLQAAIETLKTRVGEGEGATSGVQTELKDRLARAEHEILGINEWIRRVAERAEAEAARPKDPEPPPETGPPGRGTPSETPTPEGPPEQPPEPAPAASGPEHEAALQRWIERLKDPNEGIAFSATMELSRLKDLRAVPPLIDTLVTRKDYYVKLGAAQALGDLKAADGVPALIEALDDRDDLVRQAADEALRAITGQDFGFAAGLATNERRKVQGQWRKWWKSNEEPLRLRLNQPKAIEVVPPR